MKKKIVLAALACVALFAALNGCSKKPSTAADLGRVSIHLTDAPGDFEQVNLVVTGVSIHRGDDDADTSSWETLKRDTTTYDLLLLRGGVLQQLALGLVPAGHYSQIRLQLGAGSNVVVGGVTYPLVVPSGLQSGYKLVGEFDVPAGGQVELTLDFDAARSVLLTGSGRYMLKPTVRVIVGGLQSTGEIVGHLLPENVSSTVYAIQGTDTLQTATPGSDGRFSLATLVAGAYDVAVHPAAGYRDTTLAGVSVVAGATTDVGDVQLTPTAASAIVGNP